MKTRLKGRYTSFKAAEDDLIRYLRETDRWNKAIYPNKQELNGSRVK